MKNFRIVEFKGDLFYQVFYTSALSFGYRTLAPCGSVIESRSLQYHPTFANPGVDCVIKFLKPKNLSRKPRVLKRVKVRVNGDKTHVYV